MWFCVTLFGVAWPGLAWPGLAWPGLAWPGLAWLGLAWRSVSVSNHAKLIYFTNIDNILYFLTSENVPSGLSPSFSGFSFLRSWPFPSGGWAFLRLALSYHCLAFLSAGLPFPDSGLACLLRVGPGVDLSIFLVVGPSLFLGVGLSCLVLALLSFSGLALLSRVWPFLLRVGPSISGFGRVWPFLLGVGSLFSVFLLLGGLALPSFGPFLSWFGFSFCGFALPCLLVGGPSFFLGVGPSSFLAVGPSFWGLALLSRGWPSSLGVWPFLLGVGPSFSDLFPSRCVARP